jgi:Leucine-rich repeat (LRR) protein
MDKPDEILTIERAYNIILKEISTKQNILQSDNKNTYQLNIDGKVVGLNLLGNEITEIEHLEELKLLSVLNLYDNQITEIKNLEELKQLSILNLSGNEISEIKNLEELKLLSTLNLSFNRIIEIENLEELKQLSKLELSENKIKEIKNLEELKQLSTLSLLGNQITEIKNLEELKQLSDLDLSENQITEIKNLEELKQLSMLYLSANQITEIKNLEELKELSMLDLYDNQITEIKNLGKLKQLLTLDLLQNEIKEIKNLEELKQLSHLNLSANQITEIKNLEELKQLSMLYLSGNEITKIKNLKELKQLSGLNLSTNQITEVENVEELKQLSELDLSENQIIEIKNLEELKQLSGLNLSANEITEIKNLEELKQLLSLDLSANEITEIKNLEELKQLLSLDLSANEITEIKNLKELKQLSSLYLSANKIIEIKSLEELKQLSSLDLSDNKINNLYPLFPYFERDLDISENSYYTKGIVIKNNPLRKPPIKIVEQGKEKIIEWFQEAEQHGTEPLYEAKLLIVGEPRHGKSSLRKKLLDCEYKIPDEYLEETLGVEIHPNYEVLIPESTENIKVNIWDFGGQEKQYYLHQYFLKKNAVYVLVSDDRKDNTNFDYWMSKLKLFTGNENEISILFNQINRTTKSTNFNPKKYEELGFVFQEFHLDLSKDQERFKEFKNYIDQSILQLAHIGEEYPKYCKAISDKLDEKKEKEQLDYITIEGFEKLCDELGYKEPKIIQKALEYLDLIGKIIYYESDHSLNHLVILNPHWLIDAIYGIITSKELEDKKGKFTKNWLNNYLQKPQENRGKQYVKSEIDNILRLMLKNHYDICYTINDKDYLIPLLMSNELQKNDVDFSDGLQIIFKYEIMPKGLIPRLLVRKSEYIFKDLICNSAGILFHDNTYAYVTEHFEKNDANRYIKIITKGEKKMSFCKK